MENVTALTGPNLTAFVTVLVALMGLYILACQVVESTRKLRRKKHQQENDLANRYSECDRRFANDLEAIRSIKAEMENIKKQVNDQGECNRMLIGGVYELLEHELHNGNAAGMQKESDKMRNYLIDHGVK